MSEHVIGQIMINREFVFFPNMSQHVQVPIGTNPVEFEDVSSNFEVQAAQNSNSIVPLGLVSYQRMRGLPPKEGLSTSGEAGAVSEMQNGLDMVHSQPSKRTLGRADAWNGVLETIQKYPKSQ